MITKPKKKPSPYLIILLGFFGVIAVGTALLLLPFSTRGGIRFEDALFISASSVCITGLTPLNIAETFTGFGQAVICILIQVGGLGFVTVGMTIIALLGGRAGLLGKRLISETLGASGKLDYKRFLFRAVLITAIMETFGFIINLIALRNDYTGGKLVWVSLFHAVSSFNNAGLDLFGSGMLPYSGNVLLILNTALLTIVGGLGFIVIIDIFAAKRWRRFSVHTKVVLVITPLLLSIGALLLWVGELGNPETDMNLLNAFFMSTMARTCGFATQDIGKWRNSSLCVLNMLMFIGAGPVSTGGGIKCTTFFVFLAGLLGMLRGRPTIVFHREVSRETLIYAMFVTMVAVIYAVLTGTLIAVCEPACSLTFIFTETISALANVGLSAGITPTLSVGSKLLLTLAMYLGRIGFMTALLVFKRRWNRRQDESVRYVQADIVIG